jgi:hypothetical protein
MANRIGPGDTFTIGKTAKVTAMPRHNAVTFLRLLELLTRKPVVTYDDMMCVAWGHEPGCAHQKAHCWPESIARNWVLYVVRNGWMVRHEQD